MDTVIAFLSLALFIAFIVGLIKPSLVRMPNRKRSSAVYLGGCLALGVIGSILWPTEKSQPVEKLMRWRLKRNRLRQRLSMQIKPSKNIATSQKKPDTISLKTMLISKVYRPALLMFFMLV